MIFKLDLKTKSRNYSWEWNLFDDVTNCIIDHPLFLISNFTNVRRHQIGKLKGNRHEETRFFLYDWKIIQLLNFKKKRSYNKYKWSVLHKFGNNKFSLLYITYFSRNPLITSLNHRYCIYSISYRNLLILP